MSAITTYGLQMLENYQRKLNRESNENKDGLNIQGSNVDLEKMKWPDLGVGGTAAKSSDQANLPSEENGLFS